MNYFFLLAILSFSFLKTSAQEQKLTVGTQPAEIIRMGDDLHVFCSGWDMNGNGIVEKNSGDVEASWWIFDAATMNLKRSKILEGCFLKEAPLNLAYNSRFFFLFQKDSIRGYSRETLKDVIKLGVADSLKNITMINFDPLTIGDTNTFGLQVISKGENNYYETYYHSNTWSLDYFEIQQPSVIPFQNPVQYFLTIGEEYPDNTKWDFQIILDRGVPGIKNATINRPFSGSKEYSTILGENANFMKRKKDSIFVIMYGDHSIKIVHDFNGQIVKTIPTQTTGANGPRECAIDGDNLYVTTYNCDIRRFSISTGQLLNILPISGKADPIQIVKGKLIVGITRTCDSLPNNTISVIDITTSVGEEEPFAIAASVSPNPFKNSASISASFPPHIHSATIEIFTSSGNSLGIFTKEVENSELNFALESDVLKLAQGQYMARISAGKQMSVVPFVVIR